MCGSIGCEVLSTQSVNYVTPSRAAKDCDNRFSMSVRLSASHLAYFKNHVDPNFAKFSVYVARGCGLVVLWRNCEFAICNVLPVLWMSTSWYAKATQTGRPFKVTHQGQHVRTAVHR